MRRNDNTRASFRLPRPAQIRLSPPRRVSLEDAIGYVRDGELIEVTPAAVRLRKRELNSSVRKTADRRSAKLNAAGG